MFRARTRRLSARKLWIAFALGSSGKLTVDAGARTALKRGDASLLSVGVIGSSGVFRQGDAVEIAGPDGLVFAKGLVRYGSREISMYAGESSHSLPAGTSPEVVHKDDLVILE